MRKCKKGKKKKNMISSVRIHYGLGDPLSEHSQNANESVNRMIKRPKQKNTLTVKGTVQLVQREVKVQEEMLKIGKR